MKNTENIEQDLISTKKEGVLKRKLSWGKYTAIALATSLAPIAAHADDTKFSGFKDSITDLIQGSLGKGVSLVALLLGGLMGLAKSSAWPALTGLAIAAVFGIGPYLIETIFDMFSGTTDNP